ncbi:ATPase [Actinoplanes italicus]|uniref:histidine kinase n=1 Tax=Actinoplanes italicus TaxID=113567 RepID=A0A2T0JWR4_9ACTN|nr:sensor histidine kinase [Actinoplanes italicus]PRX12214.1 sensor histidine kinase regulating citrate/malate metabolism [Actinoplanes italicus]GIE35850.1 ATPase [Actinoplanes italicus]
MRWKFSLAGQFLVLQFGIVLLVVGAVAAVSLAEADAAFRRDQGAKLRSSAENLAATDVIRAGMSGVPWFDALAARAETARSVSGASFVELTDEGGVLLTGPERGRPAALADSGALTGRAWLGVVEHNGRALVAHAPVLDPENGGVLGLVMVGKTYPTLPESLASATADLLTYLLLGSVLGGVGSILLSRRIKRQTLGLEPVEIAGLVEHREAMLHGIKEGLIGVDPAGHVTLANDEARRLLGLSGEVNGRTLRSLGVPEELLTGGSDEPDRVVVHDSRVLVLNRMPVVVRGRAAGSVTTLRDRTELTSLERELDLSRHTTDTLRAQAHEFTNRLHTISGLVQLGQYDEAVNFIITAGELHNALNHEVQSRIADPALAALIIAKASVASEQHVELRVAEETSMPAPVGDRLAADLVTVVGNLIDNALDAVGPDGWVSVAVRDLGDEIEVIVTDSGAGVAQEHADKVFSSGFTTKSGDGHRGLGLALISRVCTARGGGITVDGSAFTARLPVDAEEPE